MSNTTELARREERAQGGIIQFAEEMQAIRDGNLYPGAKQAPDAWKSYCKERWGQSHKHVDETIQALPVLRRFRSDAVGPEMPSVSAASRVASLPEKVQDAILTDSPKRNDASDKAKAVRKEAERVRVQEGREPTDDELVEVAKKEPKAKKKPKHKMKDSKFISAIGQAEWFAECAADIAQGDVLSDTENDFGWSMVAKVKYQLSRIEDKLYRPEIAKDADEEFAKLLGGEEA